MTAAHFRRISRADFTAMWLDRAIPRKQIAVTVGLCEKAVSKRAKAYGLEQRGHSTKKPTITDAGLFTAMWRDGVSAAEIADHFEVSYRTVANTVGRLKLRPRGPGTRPKMGIEAFLISRVLATDAAAVKAQWAMAEMVDHKATSSGRWAA